MTSRKFCSVEIPTSQQLQLLVSENASSSGSAPAMASECCDCCGIISGFFFEYDTQKIVLIKNRKVGLMNRLVQLIILAYVIGWVFVWQKGYQEVDKVLSSVSTKVKGVAKTNSTKMGLKIWDVADYVIPPQEENSFFVMTNMLLTMNQKQGHCPEVPSATSVCHTDSDCTADVPDIHSSGIPTGKCVSYNATVKTCEVFAWCPIEKDTGVPTPALLGAAENFTVLIKNNIRYPKFNFTKRNILEIVNSSYLGKCLFNRKTDPNCPIFRLRDIVREANVDFQEMAIQGGVMGIQIKWDCDLDKSASKCIPEYSFRRLDNKNEEHNVAPGYNFRFAKYYKDVNDTETRTLIKAYGIRFEVLVFGQAGKFNIIPTMINIGSGLALLGVATVLCDIIVLYILKKKYYYREKKYKYVEDYELGINEQDTYKTSH